MVLGLGLWGSGVRALSSRILSLGFINLGLWYSHLRFKV